MRRRGETGFWRGTSLRWGSWLVILSGLLLLTQSCGTLPASWCKVEKVDTAVVGDPQINRCTEDFCTIVRGQWEVNSAWMYDNESLLESMIRKLQECEK